MDTGFTQPGTSTENMVDHDDLYEVILYNDDHNTADFVVACLTRIFGHTPQMAAKIMVESHTKGHAIAQVEPESDAKNHCAQLQEAGLGASVEKI